MRHRDTGTQFFLRQFSGDGCAYRKLLRGNSPHLPKIHRVLETEGQVLVLEEYISGETLNDVLKRKKYSPREARALLLQLCRGVKALHDLGIVHRDIKPDNVILHPDRAVLVDFDAARLYEPGTAVDTQVLGTVGYAAPEQFGISQSDRRADIYAMGVLLNVMITGHHPSAGQLAAGPVRKVIRRCTMINPDDRYQTTAQLMAALRIHPRPIWAAAIAAFAAAALLAIFLPRLPASSPAAEHSIPPEPTPPQSVADTPSQQSPSPEPSSPLFSIDAGVSLEYGIQHFNGGNVRFTGLTAQKTAEGSVTFTVFYDAQKNHNVVVSDGFEPQWVLRSSEPAKAGRHSYTFTLSSVQMTTAQNMSVCFWTYEEGTNKQEQSTIAPTGAAFINLCRSFAPDGSSPALELPPLDTPVEVEYSTIVEGGDDASPPLFSPGRLTAVRSSDGIVTFTLEFTAEEGFYLSVFYPPGGPTLLCTTIFPEETSISFSADVNDLPAMNGITLKFTQLDGGSGNPLVYMNPSQLRPLYATDSTENTGSH